MLSGNSRALRPLLSQGFVVRSRNGLTWSTPSDRIRLLSPDRLAKNKVLSWQINAACRSLSDPSISLFLALDSDQRSKTTQQMNFDSNKQRRLGGGHAVKVMNIPPKITGHYSHHVETAGGWTNHQHGRLKLNNDTSNQTNHWSSPVFKKTDCDYVLR